MKNEQRANWTWADFIKRFKAKRLGFGDIDPLGIRIGLLSLPSMAGLLLIDSESDLFSTRLTILIAIIIFVFITALFGTFSAHAKWPRVNFVSTIWMIVWPFLVGVIWTPMLGGYLLWVNALCGEQNKIILTGPVIEKTVGGGRYTGKDYFITIKPDNRPVKLAVTPNDYANYPLGSMYSREMIHGGLGIYYSWGIGMWK